MGSQIDLDQGGTLRETTRIYLGPSVGWSQGAAPPTSPLLVTGAGTTTIAAGTSLVHVSANGSVTLQLPPAKGNAAGAGPVPGTWTQRLLTINDLGGFAATFPITILPAAGDTIVGLSSATISSNFGVLNLLSDVQNGGWTIVSSSYVTAISDAPSNGTTYGRLNAAWTPVVPLAGATMTGALVLNADPAVALGASTKQYVDNTASALQTTIQSYVNAGMRSYLAGLTMSTAGGSATFSVAAGNATDSTNVDMMALASSISKTTGAWAVGSGNGALDSGSIAASTWYHVYLIKRTDTGVVDVLVSLSPSAPTMPASYTERRRIGAMMTDGSSFWLLFHQLGDEFLWDVTINDVNVVNLGTTSTLYPLTVPPGVQVNAMVRVSLTSGTAGTVVLVTSPNASAEAINSVPGNATLTNANTTTSARMTMNIRTSTSAQIRAVASAASTTFQVATFGWIDRRGRDL